MTTDCKYHVDKMGNINIIYGEKNSRFPFCNTIFIESLSDSRLLNFFKIFSG